jgi:hypothetical protein
MNRERLSTLDSRRRLWLPLVLSAALGLSLVAHESQGDALVPAPADDTGAAPDLLQGIPLTETGSNAPIDGELAAEFDAEEAEQLEALGYSPQMAAMSGSTFPHPLATEDAQTAIAWVMANLGAPTVRDALYYIEYFTEVRSIGPVGSFTRMSARVAQRSGPIPSTTYTHTYHETAFGIAADWLNGAATPPATVDVWISTKFPSVNPVPSVTSELMAQITEGSITSPAQLKAARDNLIAQRTSAGQAWLDPLLSWVTAQGGTVVETVPFAGTARIQLPFGGLDDLLARAEVTAVAANSVDEDDSCDPDPPASSRITGVELAEITQASQFYLDGVHGTGVEFGIVESESAKIYRAHPGFKDFFGTQRFKNCQAPFCTNGNPTSLTQPGAHATATASTLLGDLTLGQDPNFAAASPDAEERSGVARRATGVGVSTNKISFAINQLMSANHAIQIVNRSSSTADDPTCSGAAPQVATWESLYESGLALFNSSGNNGTLRGPMDCVVNSPATAIGVFAVSQGGLTNTGALSPVGGLTGASLGGTAVEGRGRSIIAALGPQPVENPFAHYNQPIFPTGIATRYSDERSC